MRRCWILLTALFVLCLFVPGGAQAIVVQDQQHTFGVAMVPGTQANLFGAGYTAVKSSVSPCDPWLESDLVLPSGGLCWHIGPVMHRNETFALTWDPHRMYWQTTRDYVEQFLRDVADGAGTLTAPYAITGQYADGGADPSNPNDPQNPTGPNPNGQARNASLYGGGCIDFGSVGGSSCQFGSAAGTAQGRDYPSHDTCPRSGSATYCLTDSDIASEVANMVQSTDITQRHEPEYTPLVVVLMPPNVEVCLDSAGRLCSANNQGSPAKFCSYHSHVATSAGDVAYVVQPWTALTQCDDPDLQPIPLDPTAQQLAIAMGARLVSPLSQGQLAALVDPDFNGWFAADGTEINDNTCVPEGDPSHPLDKAIVGTSGQNPYYLQREYSNSGLIQSDPNGPTCSPVVVLDPAFVVPSSVNESDVVEFDGSATASSLIVPGANYAWDFGDGSTGTGPSVVHAYHKAGTYTVMLTVIDRGGNAARLSQTISVLGPKGQVVSPPGGSGAAQPLQVHLQLMPQALKTLLRRGIALRLTANEAADGLATVTILRSAARKARLKVGRSRAVVVGRGTVSGIKDGTVMLHLKLSKATARKLLRLKHLQLSVRLVLVSKAGNRVAVDVAGKY